MSNEELEFYRLLRKCNTYGEMNKIIQDMLTQKLNPIEFMNTIVYKRVVLELKQPESFHSIWQIVIKAMAKWPGEKSENAVAKRIRFVSPEFNRKGNSSKNIKYIQSNLSHPYQGGRTSGK